MKENLIKYLFNLFNNYRHTTMSLNQTSGSSNDGALSPEEFYDYMTTFSLYYLYIGIGVLFAAFIQVQFL